MAAYYNEIDPYAAQWLRNLIADGHLAEGDVDERSIMEVKPQELSGYAQCHFFAGIGGWSRALRLAGWPDDRPVWTGSCPCQPFSSAGKRSRQQDERHLWPHWRRLISERRPATVFGEQVASAVAAGWWDDVAADLEAEGYACAAAVLPACSVGYPHRRDRLWFVADATGERVFRTERPSGTQTSGQERNNSVQLGGTSKTCDVADTEGGYRRPGLCGGESGRHGQRQSANTGGANSIVENTESIGPRKGGPNQRGSKGDLALPAQAHHAALWATPSATDGGRGGTITENMTGISLAQQSMWATPSARDWKDSQEMTKVAGGGDVGSINCHAKPLWLTPSASEDAAGTIHGKMQPMLTHQAKEADMAKSNGLNAPTEKHGQLNPAFVCWLMGYPPEWDACAPTAMQSSRRSRRNSSKQA